MLCFCSATLAFPGEPSQPCPVHTKFWPMGVRVPLKCAKCSSLMLLVWEWMESPSIPSRFQPAAEVGHFWQGITPTGAGSAAVSCFPHSDSTGHCAMPPPQQDYHPHPWMTPSLCQRAQQAASLLQLSCIDPLIPFPRASLSCLLILWFLPAGITSETLW